MVVVAQFKIVKKNWNNLTTLKMMNGYENAVHIHSGIQFPFKLK